MSIYIVQKSEFTNAGQTAQVNSCGSNHLKVLKVLKSAKVGPMQKFKIKVHLHFYTGGVKHSHKKETHGMGHSPGMTNCSNF